MIRKNFAKLLGLGAIAQEFWLDNYLGCRFVNAGCSHDRGFQSPGRLERNVVATLAMLLLFVEIPGIADSQPRL